MRVQATPQFDAFCSDVLREPAPRPRRQHCRVPITRAERNLYGMGWMAAAPAAAGATGGTGAASGILAAAGGPIGAAIAGVSVLAQFLASKFGPSPFNVPAAQAEQVFEAAALNVENLAKAGMIAPSQAVTGQQTFLSMGTQHIGSQQFKKPGQQAIQNMTSVILQIMARTQALPEKITQPLDLARARSYYVGGGNWYGDSLRSGAQLTDEFLQTLQASGAVTQPTAARGGPAAANSAVPLGLLAAGALAIWAIA